MRDTFVSPDVDAAAKAAQQQPAAEWIKPEVAKLDLETAQQTGIPG